MTFTQLVTDICDRLSLTSSDSQTRIGREVNRYYRRIRTALGLQDATMRAVAVSAAKNLGLATVTFTGVQKVTRVYDDTSGTRRYLKERPWDYLRERNPGTTNPTEWALQSADDDSVTILINVLAQDTDDLKADGFLVTSDLSGSQVPAFPEDFHDILIEGVLADEYRKRERVDLAKIAKTEYEARLSDLRMWFAKSIDDTTRQGELAGTFTGRASGGTGSGGGAPSGGTSYTQTGLITFDRDPDAPFAVTPGSDVVDNLLVAALGGITTDRLIGRDTAGTGASEEITVGGGLEFTGSGGIQTSALTGDVTKSAGGTATTIANDAVTYAKMQNVSAASKLLGRGSAAGSGNAEEITLGTGLSMSGTTLNGTAATPPGGSDTHVQFNDSSAFGGDAGLVYNKTTDTLTLAGPLVISGAAAGQVVFPAGQNASSNVNTLDDYEEGTWTPTIGGSGGQSGQAYSSQVGNYVKIGKLVTCMFSVTLSTLGTITTSVQLKGLPFTSATTGAAGGGAVAWVNSTSAFFSLTSNVESNSTVATVYGSSGGGTTVTALVQGDLSNTTGLSGTFSYIASA